MVGTLDNLVDFFTKPILLNKFKYLLDLINIDKYVGRDY